MCEISFEDFFGFSPENEEEEINFQRMLKRDNGENNLEKNNKEKKENSLRKNESQNVEEKVPFNLINSWDGPNELKNENTLIIDKNENQSKRNEKTLLGEKRANPINEEEILKEIRRLLKENNLDHKYEITLKQSSSNSFYKKY